MAYHTANCPTYSKPSVKRELSLAFLLLTKQTKKMKREIKFRAWDAHFKMMYYFENDGMWDTNWLDTIYSMQFTGLHDKNGKEIFEGDILKHPNWKALFTVVYISEKCQFVAKMNDGRTQYIDPQYISVIGNIHENPELIAEAN